MKEENQGCLWMNNLPKVTEAGFPTRSPKPLARLLCACEELTLNHSKMATGICDKLISAFLRGGKVPGLDQDTVI